MSNNHNEVITVEIERLATVENEVKHQGKDISEIKGDISKLLESSKNVEIAIVELAEISKDNKRIYPRLEKLEATVSKQAIQFARWAGAITVIMFALTFFKAPILAIFS